MTWSYAYTPQIWPPLVTVLFLLLLAIDSWPRRNVPGALPFMIGCLFTLLIVTGLLMTNLAADPRTKILWVKYQTAWLLPSTTGIACFLLEYAWPGRWLTSSNRSRLSIPCLLAFGLILTPTSTT